MSVVYNSYAMVCPPVREIIHGLMLVDYHLVQTDKPWYNYYLSLHVDMPLTVGNFLPALTVAKIIQLNRISTVVLFMFFFLPQWFPPKQNTQAPA